MAQAKISAGDAAIALAIAGTATNNRFVKALYSIRGTLLLRASGLAGYPYPVEVVRSAVVATVKALPDDEVCTLRLEPGKNGAEWYLCEGTAPVKRKRERKPGTAPVDAPTGDAQGTEHEPAAT
jgi:hypothetical protein